MNEEDKLIEEQFKKLPVELQQALNAVPWKTSVKEIATANKLSPEQAENLERETLFILYGFENPADYIDKLAQEMPVDEETAATIAEQVEEKIFKPISGRLESKEEKSTVNLAPKETKEEAIRRLMEKRQQTGQKASIPVDSKQQIVDREEAKVPPASAPDFAEATPDKQGSGLAMEVAPDIHPVATGSPVEVRSMEHEVKKEEKPKPLTSVPNYSYQPGQDPYREPLQ